MEVTLGKNDRPAEQANFLMVISQSLQKTIGWMNWFFTMTKLDKFKAGIDTSGEGREE